MAGAQAVMDPPAAVVADGESYERAVEAWLQVHNTVSPATGLPLESTALVSNHAPHNY